MVKTKKRKKVILGILICLLFISLPLSGYSSSFSDRRQAWLDRNGKTLDGRYLYQKNRVSDAYHGRPYIFAWLEKGIYFKSPPSQKRYPGLGSVNKEINLFFEHKHINDASSAAMLSLIRLLYLQPYSSILGASNMVWTKGGGLDEGTGEGKETGSGKKNSDSSKKKIRIKSIEKYLNMRSKQNIFSFFLSSFIPLTFSRNFQSSFSNVTGGGTTQTSGLSLQMKIKDFFDDCLGMHGCVVSRTGGHSSCSTQPTRTVAAFLHAQENRDKKFKYEGPRWRSSYSGTLYEPGKKYSAYEFTRDSLFYFFDNCLVKPNNGELDGSYTGILFNGLLALYDLAGRPLAYLGGEPDPEGIEIKKRAKMMLDFMLLESGMDFSARHKGGAQGRSYQHLALDNAACGGYLYPLAGIEVPSIRHQGPDKRDAIAYTSHYRPASAVVDAVNIQDEPDDYWHIQKELSAAADTDKRAGKWAYITKYYNIGAASSVSGRPRWKIAIDPQVNNFYKEQYLMLWVDDIASSSEKCDLTEKKEDGTEFENWHKTCNVVWGMGYRDFWHYRNAVLVRMERKKEAHLHIVKSVKLDEGESLLKPASDKKNDYRIEKDKWYFFRKGKVMVALRLLSRAVKAIGIEVAVEGVDYPSFSSFKKAVESVAKVGGADSASTVYFRTSKGDIIKPRRSGIEGDGLVNGVRIWDFPFKRMEADYGYSSKGIEGTLISWDKDRKVMKVTSTHGLVCTYDFKSWDYYGNGCGEKIAHYKDKPRTISGDVNEDGKTDIRDLGIIFSYWEKRAREVFAYPKIDLFKDKIINSKDASIILNLLLR